MAGRPDPKPARRIHDSQAGKAKVEWEARCRICRAPGRRITGQRDEARLSDGAEWAYMGLTRHHLVPKSRGGDDVDDNIVPLCGSGTTGCHGDVEHYVPGAREALRARLLPCEVDYVIARQGGGDAVKGRAWLDRHYP